MKADIISKAFGFRSATATAIARVGIALSCLAALAAIPGYERMLGCLGFLGLIGVETVIDFACRRHDVRS